MTPTQKLALTHVKRLENMNRQMQICLARIRAKDRGDSPEERRKAFYVVGDEVGKSGAPT